MQEQYVGDVSDYRKYALLRWLAKAELKIGVCWMLTVPRDGQMRSYLRQPHTWRDPDPGLFDVLKSVTEHPETSRLSQLQERAVIPDAVYFNASLRDDAKERAAYFVQAAKVLSDCDLVFFDPDNGFDSRMARRQKTSSKHVSIAEVASFAAAGKSVLVYQHFARQRRDKFVKELSERLSQATGGWPTRAFQTSHAAFFLAVHPSHERLLDLSLGPLEQPPLNIKSVGGARGADP